LSTAITHPDVSQYTLEGDWDEILRLVRKCHKRTLEDSDRVLTTITIDDRKGKSNRIVGKIQSVKRKLGKESRK
jgi:uncharacterized protein YqgV (UPF0045/DUF77 family)